MSQTPVKVPASAAAYTPATQDQDLRSQINALLIREGHINKIQEHFLHSLNAHPSNWPSAVQSHALALLRSGDVTTFPALVRRVLEDVRHDTAAASDGTTNTTTNSNSNTNNNNNNNNNSTTSTNGSTKTNGASTNTTTTTTTTDGSLAVPQAVVDAVLKVARECLDTVCEVDDGSTAG
ncbi:uncharacterized protein F4817DRAFT_337086 [Daldinia loculata]|uniref:uncharacterized protein n=1 Tax=Daldinia loculata TaxID=103429 RepID=UPI0020C2B161|nr:uncharacterized protein F4817DRAFT_337086 [Daldinia loculata]KAI1647575.1 hypothetical protein F4817DRAFT_337086 [Daldinia loculata]